MSNQLVAEMKTYKLLEQLTSRAASVFTSRDSYTAFISQMNYAYSKGLSLNDFAFAINILEKINVDNQFLLSARRAEGNAKLNKTTATPQTETKNNQPNQIGAIIEHFVVKRIATSVKQATQTSGTVGSDIKTTFEEIKHHFMEQTKDVNIIPPDDEKKQNENPEAPQNPFSQKEIAKLSTLFTSSAYYQKHKAETIKRIEKYYYGIKPDQDKLIEELKTKNLSYYEYRKELAKIKFESKYFNVINAFVRGEITAQQFEQITSGKTQSTAVGIVGNQTRTIVKTNTGTRDDTVVDVGGTISIGGTNSVESKVNYNTLLARAKEVFPTTQSYNDFVAQLDTAVSAGESLSSFDFALTTFETLKASENSPYYQDELARISLDPQFSAFATIAENLNVPYAEPLFTATKEISTALEDNATLGVNTNIVSTTPDEDTTEDLLAQVKPTNKIVLQVDSNGIIGNPEVLLSPDGIVGKERITTSKLEQSKMEALGSKISSAGSEEEAADLVESYNTSTTASPISPVEMAETFTSNLDIGMTSDNPIDKETQGLAVDSSTANQLEKEEEEVIKFYYEAIRKLKQDNEEGFDMLSGGSSAESGGPTLEA